VVRLLGIRQWRSEDTLRPGAKIFLRLHNKNYRVRSENYAQSAKEANAEHLLFVTLVIFRSNKTCFNARNAVDTRQMYIGNFTAFF